MKILLAAKYISGKAEEGGSSRFFCCVRISLVKLGHTVICANEIDIDDYIDGEYDLIICSHNSILRKLKNNRVPKICISHGIVGDENLTFGADRYISVSEEVRQDNKMRGIDSDVVGQPIYIKDKIRPNGKLEKILIIRRHPISEDMLSFLNKKYDVRISDISKPIEGQIAWADLCIAVGRGALESMAQGKPVIVADSRPYHYEMFGNAWLGDGYVSPELIGEIAKNNFSGRRFKIPVTREWIEAELRKYDSKHSDFLYSYVKENHESKTIVSRYLEPINKNDDSYIGFGVMINDIQRFNQVLQKSDIHGDIEFVKDPESATTALNTLLGRIESKGNDIAILTHLDMYYRSGWVDKVRSQLKLLPENWIVAGIIGKDADGMICGRFRDMRIPQWFNTSHIHNFPHPVCCFDECCLIINLKSGFRFDESMKGFDLYGTLCVLQAWEMGGSAWVIDAPAEHYCMRSFSWEPDELFKSNYKMLWDRFENMRIDSTAIGTVDGTDERDIRKMAFMTSAN